MFSLRIALGAVTALLLTGCMVGPNFQRPEAPATARYTETPLPAETASAPGSGGAAQRFVPGAELPGEWWSLYRSEPLQRLIQEALAANPTLAAARATLRQAQENLAARTGALLYPSVNANASATREKISNAGFGASGASLFNLYNASVDVSYMLDLFGGNRRQLESLQAAVDYQDYQLAGAHLALTANIVTAAVQEASLRAQIQATREVEAAQQQILDVVEKQLKLGAVARADVLAQRAQLAQTRATLPALEKALAQARNTLAALVGR
ncbi:MAG TPA: TolC family protein, partial [Burkholderiales bacterium]